MTWFPPAYEMPDLLIAAIVIMLRIVCGLFWAFRADQVEWQDEPGEE